MSKQKMNKSEGEIEDVETVESDHSADTGNMVDEGAISDPTPDDGVSQEQATPDDALDTTEGTEESESPVSESDDEQDTFPRDYVEKLRDENARYRQRAGQADELAQQLHGLLVEKTGRLADPSDLEFSDEHLADPEKLNGAIDELLARKPHLASRIARGDIGQGGTSSDPEFSLTSLMRSNV